MSPPRNGEVTPVSARSAGCPAFRRSARWHGLAKPSRFVPSFSLVHPRLLLRILTFSSFLDMPNKQRRKFAIVPCRIGLHSIWIAEEEELAQPPRCKKTVSCALCICQLSAARQIWERSDPIAILQDHTHSQEQNLWLRWEACQGT